MINKEVLDSLPVDERKRVIELYDRMKKGELTHSEFVSECESLVEDGSLLRAKEPGRRGRPPMGRGEAEPKPEYMSDIIHYAGVNLKEEALSMAQESDASGGVGEAVTVDYRNSPEFLFDLPNYSSFVTKLARIRDTGISEGAKAMIYQAVKRKLLDTMEKLIFNSKIRMDIARSEYLIRIENDTRRQLWFLEQEERIEMEKFKNKKEGEEEGKKKLRRIMQEREDLIIKKRLSNNVALAALGSQPKSWMNVDTSPTGDDGSAPYLNLFQGSDTERGSKGSSRVIIKEDLISVLLRDKRYNKSIFTIRNVY